MAKEKIESQRIVIPRIEDNPEHQQRSGQLNSEKAELFAEESRVEEIRVTLQKQGTGSRIKDVTYAAMAALGLGKQPEFKVEELSREKADIEKGLPMRREKIRLLENELKKLETRLYSERNEQLREPYKARLQRAYALGLAFAKEITSIEHDIIEELQLRGGAFAHVIEPFQFRELDLTDQQSKFNQRCRELKEYGVTVEGWEDPVASRQLQPGTPRKVRLLGTMIGPQGAKFKGDIIKSEFADYLVASRQAVEVGQIEALRAKLDAIPAT